MSVGPRDYSSFSSFRFLALLLEAADFLLKSASLSSFKFFTGLSAWFSTESVECCSARPVPRGDVVLVVRALFGDVGLNRPSHLAWFLFVFVLVIL